MAKKKKPTASNGYFEQARDELFSHILRCGVLQAALEHQQEWFDDTMEYLAERYEMLTDEQLKQVRTLGERYVQPVIPHTTTETVESVTSN